MRAIRWRLSGGSDDQGGKPPGPIGGTIGRAIGPGGRGSPVAMGFRMGRAVVPPVFL